MDAKPLRILVVEEHHDTRKLLVMLLSSSGHRVESCPNGRSALERIKHDELDVLLTDMWLPDMDGWSYLTELSKLGTLPSRVISMSAGDPVQQRLQSKAAGCSLHLVKPFKAEELEAALR